MIILLSNAAQVYETVKLNNSAFLSIAIFLGLAFIVGLIITIFRSGK